MPRKHCSPQSALSKAFRNRKKLFLNAIFLKMLDPFEKEQQKIQPLFKGFYTVDCPAVAMQVEQII